VPLSAASKANLPPRSAPAAKNIAVALLLPYNPMATIPQKELRNNIGEVLRRAEAGEQMVITVAGRPVARLGPAERRRWLTGSDLRAVWRTPAPRTLAEDLRRFPTALEDPFA
jgi:prevent-host-death family protein